MNLNKLTKTDLYGMAQKLNIPNRSKMTKEELIKAIKKYQKMVAQTEAPQTQKESPSVTSQMPEEPQQPTHAKPPEYRIPDKYSMDTVVLLPVNPKKEYVYWEVSDKTAESFCSRLNIPSPVFILKVFSSEEDSTQELASVRVSKYGNWYFDLYCPDARLWAEIGVLDSMGNYYAITSSKKIKMPTDKVSSEIDKETWMTVGEKIERIFELSGLSDVQKQELMSSARMHSELFKKLHAQESVSSTAIFNKQAGE